MISVAESINSFSHLSGPAQRLLRMMQAVNFGAITFTTRSGRPDIDTPWRTRQTVKLAGKEIGPRPEAALADFELRREQIALLSALSRIEDGACVKVEVRHGLPFLIEIEEDHRAA